MPSTDAWAQLICCPEVAVDLLRPMGAITGHSVLHLIIALRSVDDSVSQSCAWELQTLRKMQAGTLAELAASFNNAGAVPLATSTLAC
jgi:hypothetical protein